MKNRLYKHLVFQDNFIKNYCCSYHNHPEGWSWWKRFVRKSTRIKLNKQLEKDIKQYEYDKDGEK